MRPTAHSSETSPARGEREGYSYDDHLALAGQVADRFAQSDAFTEAQATWTANTRRRYLNDLELFSAYIKSAHIERSAEALFNDAEAWRGMTFGLLKGFKTWLEQRGYATGTIKGSISTIHIFCRLAGPGPAGAGVLDEASLAAILTIRGTSGRKARNLDEDRKRRRIPTRKGHKKAVPTQISAVQATTLKKVTTHPERPPTREHDLLLTCRDALLMGLLVYYGNISRPFYVVLTAIVMTGSVMVSYTRARAENTIPSCKVGFMERPERIVLVILGALFERWGTMAPALWVLAVISTITVIHRIRYTWTRTEGVPPANPGLAA